MSEFINTIDVLGDDAVIDSIIDKSITELKDNRITGCGSYALSFCTKLRTVVLPIATVIADRCFLGCSSLTVIDLSKAIATNYMSFGNCYSLRAILLRGSTLSVLHNTGTLSGCFHFLGTVNETYNPNGDKDGFIYVPAALVESYKTATNWSTFADQIRALEDYTVDGTITGELDETKI